MIRAGELWKLGSTREPLPDDWLFLTLEDDRGGEVRMVCLYRDGASAHKTGEVSIEDAHEMLKDEERSRRPHHEGSILWRRVL